MTRILALGDNQRDPRSRAAEHDRVMDFVAAQVEELRPTVVANGGDWTERHSTHEDREYLFGWVRRVTEVCPLVTVQGNHEEPGFVREFAHLATTHAVAAADVPQVVIGGGVAWALLPWPSRASIRRYAEAATGRVVGADEVVETANALLERILRALRVQLEVVAGDLPRVLLAHCEPAVYSTDPDQPDHVAEGMRVSMEDAVRWTGVDLALVSHIHMPQDFAVLRDDGVAVPVILIGSPRRTAYAKGELAAKGFCVVDFDGRTSTWRRVATPATPMRLIEAVWRDGALDSEELRALPCEAFGGAEIRLRYSVSPDEREAARRVAEEFQRRAVADLGAIDVKLDEVILAESRARAPEVASAPTLRERIEATWGAMGDSAPAAERRPSVMAKCLAVAEGAGA